SAARIVSPPHHLHLDAASHPTEEGEEHAGKEVGRRGPGDVGSPDDAQSDRAWRRGGDRDQGLEDEGDASRGADIERIGPWLNLPRLECNRRRSDLEAVHLGVAQLREGADGGHVLGRESRVLPAGPNPHDADRLLRQDRERGRHPEELSATLPVRPIDLEHRGYDLIRRRTTLNTSTNANALNEIRSVSTQSRTVRGSVPKTPWRNGMQITAAWRSIEPRTAKMSFVFVKRPISQMVW